MARFQKRRAFGQHFLIDQGVIGRIVDAFVGQLEKTPCQLAIEIGPGKGALSSPLLERLKALPKAPALRLFERDRDLVKLWRTHMEGVTFPFAFDVVEGDFLKSEAKDWTEPGPVGVISNLPYSTGTAIATRLLGEGREKIPFAVLMFQAEVARRFCAEAGAPERGSLSLWTQNHWDVKRVCFVGPRAFRPPPKVDSEVLLFTRRETPRIAAAAARPELWQELLKRAFAQRRKMIRGNLSGEPFRSALARSGVDGTLRAQALEWDQWQALMESLP